MKIEEAARELCEEIQHRIDKGDEPVGGSVDTAMHALSKLLEEQKEPLEEFAKRFLETTNGGTNNYWAHRWAEELAQHLGIFHICGYTQE